VIVVTPAVIPDDLLDILDTPNIAHVATIGPGGAPHNGPVWFGWDGQYLRFSQTPHKQKTRNLVRDNRVAVSIVDANDPYRYLEIRGTVEFEDDHADAFVNAMAKRYLGVDVYPWRQPDEHFIIATVTPLRITRI
jgi:hypothetical protein